MSTGLPKQAGDFRDFVKPRSSLLITKWFPGNGIGGVACKK
jgi:hypothetical protein